MEKQPDPTYKVFLLAKDAGAAGISLTAANWLVVYEPSWNPTSDVQASGRIWPGQTRVCRILTLIGHETLEDKILLRPTMSLYKPKPVSKHQKPEHLARLRKVFAYPVIPMWQAIGGDSGLAGAASVSGITWKAMKIPPQGTVVMTRVGRQAAGALVPKPKTSALSAAAQAAPVADETLACEARPVAGPAAPVPNLQFGSGVHLPKLCAKTRKKDRSRPPAST